MCSTCFLAATPPTSALCCPAGQWARLPRRRILLLCWFALPLLAMWLVTLLPEKVRGAVNQATQAAPAGESYLNLLPQADPQDRAAFLSQYFGLPKQRVGQGLPKNEPGHHHFAGLFRRFQRHHHALHGRRKDVLP